MKQSYSFCAQRLILACGAVAPYTYHCRSGGSTGWFGAAAWPTALSDPAMSPMSAFLTPGPGVLFFVGESPAYFAGPLHHNFESL